MLLPHFLMDSTAERPRLGVYNWVCNVERREERGIGKIIKFSDVFWCKLWFCSQDLPTHSRFVSCHTLGQVHSDWVRRVRYIPAKEFVISCSGSGKDSLVVRDIDDKKRKTYTFKVAKVNTMPLDNFCFKIFKWIVCKLFNLRSKMDCKFGVR